MFRTTIKDMFVAGGIHPKVGDIVKVKYDPKSLKVKFDLKGDPRYDLKALKDQAKMQREHLLASPPGTLPPQNPMQQEQLTQEEKLAALLQVAILKVNPEQYISQEAQTSLIQYANLSKELRVNGHIGMATVLRKEDTGLALPPVIGYAVSVRVQPSWGEPFESAFTTWINTRTRSIKEGDMIQVRYDANNPARIVFEFPA
ncbi:MAG: hypothetical protein ACJ788_11095 [Ktedonobacteraceae bacterium]